MAEERFQYDLKYFLDKTLIQNYNINPQVTKHNLKTIK